MVADGVGNGGAGAQPALPDLRAPKYDEGYEHLGDHDVRTLEPNGRLILQPAWRPAFAAGARLSLFRGCLALWTLRGYGSIVAEIHAQQRQGRRAPGTVEGFRSQTRHITLDGQGRLVLPEDLRNAVGIGGGGAQVRIDGQGDRLEFRPSDRTVGLGPAELLNELADLDY